MTRNHDPFRCPHCQSTRTQSMQMVALTGTRVSTGKSNRTTIGARGWWSLSNVRTHRTSQSTLAQRYSPVAPIEAGGLIVLALIGALINGGTGAIAAILLGILMQALSSDEPPDGFVCLRCGCEFKPVQQNRLQR